MWMAQKKIYVDLIDVNLFVEIYPLKSVSATVMMSLALMPLSSTPEMTLLAASGRLQNEMITLSQTRS